MILVVVREGGQIHGPKIYPQPPGIAIEGVACARVKQDLLAGSLNVEGQAVLRLQVTPLFQPGVFDQDGYLHG